MLFDRTLANKTMSICLVLLGIAIPTAWALASYYNVDIPATLIFFGNDGWCDIGREGVGTHCFGDFHERFQLPDIRQSPSGNNLELSPIGPYITSLADLFAAFMGSRRVLLLVIVGYLCMCICPVFLVYMHRGSIFGNVCLATLGTGSYAVLAALDRLNNVMLCPPLLLAYLYAVKERNLTLLTFSIAGLVVIKPQFIFLSLVFLILDGDRIRALFRALSASILSVFLVSSLVMSAGNWKIDRLKQYIHFVTTYSQQGGGKMHALLSWYPPNYSFLKPLYLAALSFRQPGIGETVNIQIIIRLLVVISFLLPLILFWLRRVVIPHIDVAGILIIFSALATGCYVAGYYTIVNMVLVCFCSISRTSECKHQIMRSSQSRHALYRLRICKNLLAIGLSFSIVPIVVPIYSLSSMKFIRDDMGRVATATPLISSVLIMLSLAMYMTLVGNINKREDCPGQSV